MNDTKRALKDVAEMLKQEGWDKLQEQGVSVGASRAGSEPEKPQREPMPFAWLAGSAATLGVVGFIIGGYLYAASPAVVQESRLAALQAELIILHEKVSVQETKLKSTQRDLDDLRRRALPLQVSPSVPHQREEGDAHVQ